MSVTDVQPYPVVTEPDTASDLRASFKQAMRRLAGGVALLATAHDGMRHGMTVTALSSLTMEPPALLVSVNRNASAFAALVASGRFSVNLLAQAQADLATAFARKPDGEARFANGVWRNGPGDLPVLDGALTSIVCRVHDAVEFGTHAILIGRVEGLEAGRPEAGQAPGAPLVYLSGEFGQFQPLTR